MQMMPTYEELIEKMAITLDSLENDSVGWGNRTEMWKNICRSKAEAALQALFSNLPEPVPGYQNKHDLYYRQLLGMKK